MKMRMTDYGVINFLGMTTWRIRLSDGDIKVEMMLPPWNNFLWSLFRFVVVRFDHDEGLEEIRLPDKPITCFELERFSSIFLIFQWQNEEI